MTTYRPGPTLSFSGGLRYDYGKIDASAYTDPYLAIYLREQGYGDEFIRKYEWRSYPVRRHFGDYSGSLGLVWSPSGGHLLQVNVGHSFRLPEPMNWHRTEFITALSGMNREMQRLLPNVVGSLMFHIPMKMGRCR